MITFDICNEISCVFVSQVLYKEEFEKNKGRGFSVVADTPELQRIKKTQDQISNVGPKSSTKTLTWKHYVHFFSRLCIPLSRSRFFIIIIIILSLIFTFSFCFVPPNLSLHLSNCVCLCLLISHPFSLFINELITRSQNYLTLMEHLFSPTLPLSHHTCLLKYLCWLPGNIYVTELPFCSVISCQYERSKTALYHLAQETPCGWCRNYY